jgi:hypothetical protein
MSAKLLAMKLIRSLTVAAILVCVAAPLALAQTQSPPPAQRPTPPTVERRPSHVAGNFVLPLDGKNTPSVNSVEGQSESATPTIQNRAAAAALADAVQPLAPRPSTTAIAPTDKDED